MWTRAQIKEAGKIAFKKNYWICVVVALIVSLCTSTSSSSGSNSDSGTDSGYSFISSNETYYYKDGYIYVNESTEDASSDDGGFTDGPVASLWDSIIAELGETFSFTEAEMSMILTILAILLVVSLLLSIFVYSVVYVGGCRFFVVNASEKASMAELVYGFTNGRYMKNVSVMFFVNLYTFLWSLLLIIPGIIKSYEYRMVPYILADFPDVSRQEAFAMSKKMMDGEKWNAFVLDLSFFGWELVSAFTFGIAGIFYVNPYVYATNAELYLSLKNSVIPSQNMNYNMYY